MELPSPLFVGFLPRPGAAGLLVKLPENRFLYPIEQGEFYEKLVCSAAYRHIGSELLGKFVRTAWKDSRWFNTLDDETQSMVLSYLHSAGTALYRQWVEDGKRMSPEKAISVGGILLCKGVEGIFQAG